MISRCNCFYDSSDCYRCSADLFGGSGDNWTEACSGVPPRNRNGTVEEYKEPPPYPSTLTLAYVMTSEEELEAEEEVAMIIMAMEDRRVLHYGHEPTTEPTLVPTQQPTMCYVSACAEMECCGKYSSYDLDFLVCTWDPDSSGWDGVSRPHDSTECHLRDCQEESCCGEYLTYDSVGATCTWKPDVWAIGDMQHYLDDHYNGVISCDEMCHDSEEHCESMCDYLNAPEPLCKAACFDTHVTCLEDC